MVSETGLDEDSTWVSTNRAMSCEELLACGVPIEALCEQWQLQQAAQLSVRSHKCISFPQHIHNLTWLEQMLLPDWKKELDWVLTLQADVNVIKSAVNSTCTTISQGKASDAALTTLSMLKWTHSHLMKNVKSQYTSLNMHKSFPELNGLSLDLWPQNQYSKMGHC